jgi:intraflagellar transport protein 140
MDDKGRCTQSFTTDGPVKALLYTEGKDILVTVTDGLMLSQHTVARDGSTTEIMKVILHYYIM